MKKYSRILTFFVIFAFVLVFLAIAQQTEEKVVCPVSGKEIKKSEAKATYEYQGKVYYFCCEKCKEKFVKNPEKYIQKKEKTVYTCPMHSDVKSDKPGKCPKCGMNLEKKKMMMKKMCMHVKKEACPIMMLSHKKRCKC